MKIYIILADESGQKAVKECLERITKPEEIVIENGFPTAEAEGLLIWDGEARWSDVQSIREPGKRAATAKLIVVSFTEMGKKEFIRAGMLHAWKVVGKAELMEALEEARRARKEPLCPISTPGPAAPSMREVYQRLGQFAKGNLTVLFLGDAGVGKTEAARELHALSGRAGTFVHLNCALLRRDLVYGELFGAVKDAFGKSPEMKGAFERANGGTLCLDEIGELDHTMQGTLLVAVQEKVITPLGGQPKTVDVRLVAATNKDLDAAVRTRRFRQDLYLRIAMATIRIPVLRTRKEEIPEMVDMMVKEFAKSNLRIKGISKEAVGTLVEHDWPGNFHELTGVLKTAVFVECEDVIQSSTIQQLLGRTGGVRVVGDVAGAGPAPPAAAGAPPQVPPHV